MNDPAEGNPCVARSREGEISRRAMFLDLGSLNPYLRAM